MLKRTPLFEIHLKLGARMVEFGGWEMPVQYSSIVDEHLTVRQAAGLFDISHMGQFRVTGGDALEFLNQLLTNDLRKVGPGQGQYTLLCLDKGGVIDDLYAYCVGPSQFILMVNASRQEIDWSWFQSQLRARASQLEVTLENRCPAHGALAVQGPSVAEFIDRVFTSAPNSEMPQIPLGQMKKNQIGRYRFATEDLYISRTGYTGEDGFELMAPAGILPAIWDKLMEAGNQFGMKPAGLGARDTLRTEMGYPLYGHELDEQTTPIEAGLARFIGWDKEFIGRETLWAQKQGGVARKNIAFKLTEKGPPPRPQYALWSMGPRAQKIGHVVSGTQSPSLGIGIGMGLVSSDFAQPGAAIAVEVRGKQVAAQIVPKPIFRSAAKQS
jgi:aminomethyltransferase